MHALPVATQCVAEVLYFAITLCKSPYSSHRIRQMRSKAARCSIADGQIGLAHVLMRCAVAWIEGERLPKMRECRLQLPQATIAVADIVLDVGIARIVQGGGLEHRDGALPIAGRHRLLAHREIRIELRPICIRREGFHGAADRPFFGRGKLSSWRPHDRIESHSRDERRQYCSKCDHADHCGSSRLPSTRDSSNTAPLNKRSDLNSGEVATAGTGPAAVCFQRAASACLAARISGRSVSAFFVSRRSSVKYVVAFCLSPDASAALAAP